MINICTYYFKYTQCSWVTCVVYAITACLLKSAIFWTDKFGFLLYSESQIDHPCYCVMQITSKIPLLFLDNIYCVVAGISNHFLLGHQLSLNLKTCLLVKLFHQILSLQLKRVLKKLPIREWNFNNCLIIWSEKYLLNSAFYIITSKFIL